jgi:single-strand DNA-binding protein
MNSCVFTGRLTKAPEIRYTQAEKPMCVAHFTLAVDRDYKAKEGEQSADFPRFVAFGKRAEFLEKYAKQGTKLEVEAQFQSGSYKNKDGQTVFTAEFAVDKCRFAESKKAGTTAAAPAEAPKIANEVTDSFLDDFYAEVDEELPFN